MPGMSFSSALSLVSTGRTSTGRRYLGAPHDVILEREDRPSILGVPRIGHALAVHERRASPRQLKQTSRARDSYGAGHTRADAGAKRAVHDIVAIAEVILIDIALAADNAVVVGLAASRVPPQTRHRAIIWGIFGAVGLRLLFA
jgi:hypothetical protein